MTIPKSLREIVYLDYMDGCDIYYQESRRVKLTIDEEAGMVYYILQYSNDNSFIYRIGDIIGGFLGYYSYEGYIHNDAEIKMLIDGVLDAFIDTLTLAVYFINGDFHVLDNDNQKEILTSLFDNTLLFNYTKNKMLNPNTVTFNAEMGWEE